MKVGVQQHEYGFKLLQPASLTYNDVSFCPGSAEPAAGDIKTLHPGLNMLLVLGTQKGGTTWLYNALIKHPSIVAAHQRFRVPDAGAPTKEVHYLDRWPLFPGSEQEYLDCFPADARRNAITSAMQQLSRKGGASAAHPRVLMHGINGTATQPHCVGGRAITAMPATGAAGGAELPGLFDGAEETMLMDDVQRSAAIRAAEGLQHGVAFVDASPDYLAVPSVPPRVQRIAPHARFVIVLRDPVARALSSYNMDHRRFCDAGRRGFSWSQVCPRNAFMRVVHASTDVAARGDTCFFDGEDTGAPKTWQECFRCSYMLFNTTHCRTQLPAPDRGRIGCDLEPKLLTFVQYSSYAAQIAWWLAFFPPEQFLILTIAELRNPARRVEALNRVLAHARLPQAQRFTADMVRSVKGFHTGYAGHRNPAVRVGIAGLRQHMRKPVEDLQALLDTFWPDMGFAGLEREV
eukprot:jgi/Ulvmu1/11383/UM075_0045.1